MMLGPLIAAIVLTLFAFPAAAQLVPNPDVIGIRLGMSMDEAEKIIRKHMTVALVTASGARTTGKPWKPEPLWESKNFLDGKYQEVVTLINGEDGGEKVLAVFRRFRLTQGMTVQSVSTALEAKYGKMEEKEQVGPWPILHWFGGKPRHCLLRDMNSEAGVKKVVEGFHDTTIGIPSSPTPQFRTPPQTKEDVARIGPFFRQCGPAVTAQFWAEMLFTGLYDLSLFAPIFEKYRF